MVTEKGGWVRLKNVAALGLRNINGKDSNKDAGVGKVER